MKTDTRVKEQRMKRLQEELTETRGYGDKLWSLFKEYHDSLMVANREEE